MATTMRPMSADDQLRRVLRDVRLRWKLRLALRGAAVVAAVALAATLLAAAGADRLQFDAGFRLGARVLVYVAVAAVAVWALLLPLLRQAPDRQVALYLEEHEPTLDAAVLSAVEHGWTAAGPARSPFAGRLAEVAVQRTRTVDDGRNVERRP